MGASALPIHLPVMRIPAHIADLIAKLETGEITGKEKQLLDEWYHSFNDEAIEVSAAPGLTEESISNRLLQRLQESMNDEPQFITSPRRKKWRVAAAILLPALAITAFLFFQGRSSKTATEEITHEKPNDIAPGGNKAILTLADGSTVMLDDSKAGEIFEQGATRAEKLKDGLLVYSGSGEQPTETLYNTIATPRGGQYQVTLSDGTKVWLNAASSLRFPIAFTGLERLVEVTGEAYFEVTKHESMPFKVRTRNTEIEVMGTSFNINAYTDEDAIRTTLLEGAVKVSSSESGQVKQLLPGQQSGINKDGKISLVKNADTEEAVAWIKGRFQFKSSGLRAILRQLSRWYDVDVEYRGDVDLRFSGRLKRSEYVSAILEKLKLTGEVNFTIDGRKIIVTR